MEEKITVALQRAQLLDKDLRQIYTESIGKNDALLVLAGQLLESHSRLIAVLAQLQKV